MSRASAPRRPSGALTRRKKGFAALRRRLFDLRQDAASAWVRGRHRADFDDVTAFCLFVGYPRSGHSVVGALLNAHPECVISHELDAAPLVLAGCARDDLYARILVRARWFHRRGDTANRFAYRVPGQWQGRFSRLRVIGDKRGGAVTRAIAAHPDFLQRLRERVGVPVRLVHVVRNPFDNIATIALVQRLALEDAVDFYFRHVETVSGLPDRTTPGELITVRHEELIRSPHAVLGGLLDALGLAGSKAYVEACTSIVFREPTHSRRKVDWPAPVRRDVERRLDAYEFLRGYAFEVPASPGA